MNTNENLHDDYVKRVTSWLDAVGAFIDNGYSVRALYFGVASTCERQINYIESRLLPGYAARVRSLANTATSSAEDHPHIGDNEASVEDQMATAYARIEQQESAVSELRVLMTGAIERHDEVSKTLEQLTWSAIKAGSATKNATLRSKMTAEQSAKVEGYLGGQKKAAA